MTRLLLAGRCVARLARRLQSVERPGRRRIRHHQRRPGRHLRRRGADVGGDIGADTASGFVTALAVSDMYELQAAEIAMAKSATARVDELAGMIKTDHTASSSKLKFIAPTDATARRFRRLWTNAARV